MQSTFNPRRFTELLKNTLGLERRLKDAEAYLGEAEVNHRSAISLTEPIVKYDPGNVSSLNARTVLSQIVQEAETSLREAKPRYKSAFEELTQYIRDNNPLLKIRIGEYGSMHIQLAGAEQLKHNAYYLGNLIALLNIIKHDSAEKLMQNRELYHEFQMHTIRVLRGNTSFDEGNLSWSYRTSSIRELKPNYGPSTAHEFGSRVHFYDSQGYEQAFNYLHELQQAGLIKLEFDYKHRNIPQSIPTPQPILSAVVGRTVGAIVRAITR